MSVAQEWHKRDGVVETGTTGTQLRGVGTGGILDKMNLRTFTARLLRAVYYFDCVWMHARWFHDANDLTYTQQAPSTALGFLAFEFGRMQ